MTGSSAKDININIYIIKGQPNYLNFEYKDFV